MIDSKSGKINEIDVPDWDSLKNERLPMFDLAQAYQMATGRRINMATLRKRRQISGLGVIVPPKTYLLTKAEFIEVMHTPLLGCKRVVDGYSYQEE